MIRDEKGFAIGVVSTVPFSHATPAAHTNELVRLYAIGKGTRLFKEMEGKWYPCTPIIDNTQMFHAMLQGAGRPSASPLTVNLNKSFCLKNGSRLSGVLFDLHFKPRKIYSFNKKHTLF